jgi:hypothetical protein
MTKKEYQKYKEIAMKICSNDERAEDLLHDVLLQLQSNVKFNLLDEQKKVYFFVRAITNQYYSNNSYFFRQYNKFKFTEFDINREIIDDSYVDTPSVEWIKDKLQQELENNKDFWYNKGLFEMYLEHKKLEKIHKLTTIPKYSIRKTITDMKKWLKQKWEEDGQIG